MRLVPQSLLGQLALLTLGAFLAAQVISVWLFADERGAAIRAAQRFETIERAAAVVRALDTAPIESRENILAAVNSRLVRFSVSDAPLVQTSRMEFAALEGVSGPTFAFQSELIESGAGFYLYEHQALQNVKLELRLENNRWRLDLTCELFSMGWDPTTIKVRTALALCDDFDVMGG